MKITHISLSGPVTDGMSYQDNLLPKYHKLNGYDVSVITSQFVWNEQGKIVKDLRAVYDNEYGIKTIRIKNKFKTHIHSKFKLYRNLYQTIEKEKPDILFIHGVQFLDIFTIKKYLKRNPQVIAYVDNHADFSNSATNWVSKNILHGIVWKKCAQVIKPYVKKFYGVLPARVDFLIDIYKLPEEKVELLLMGAEDEKVLEVQESNIKDKIREQYNIKPNDFLIVTGGKIDHAKKQTLLLMEAVKEINHDNLKLIVFGSIVEDLKEEVTALVDDEKIKYIGWIQSEQSYDYFGAADLVVFPGRHSVFWEQVAGQGIPMMVKHWLGTEHVDVGGNCEFLYKDSKEEIKEKLETIINHPNVYERMKNAAEEKGLKNFSYFNIAKQSIMSNK